MDHVLDDAHRWVGGWSTSPQPALGEPAGYENQTLRVVVRPSIGGDRLRVRFSNTFGRAPLVIGSARIARHAAEASFEVGTDHALTFGGYRSCTVPAGALALSDPVGFDVEALSDLAVSIYLPEATTAWTSHFFALRTSYVSAARGDHAGAVELPEAATMTSCPIVTGVDVRAVAHGGAVVALGDSLVDGAASTPDRNGRWLDVLAARLREHEGTEPVALLNQGIIGNRLLAGSPEGRPFHGEAGLARFDRDVLSQVGVRYVVVVFGVNDLGFPGSVTSASEQVSTAAIVAGHRQLIERAHQRGIRVIGATTTPFEDAESGAGFHTADKESVRDEVNSWIRTGGELDGTIDFDEALRDPDHPRRLLPAYDSGDHLHPNDDGHRAMADAVDLELFRRHR